MLYIYHLLLTSLSSVQRVSGRSLKPPGNGKSAWLHLQRSGFIGNCVKSRGGGEKVEKVEKVDNVETLRLSCARGYSPLSLRPCRRVLCEPCVHL
jgi:hypothetical protein